MSHIIATARRERILTEAVTWAGTPYRSRHYPVKGPTGGCDCASYILGVAMGAGLVPEGTPLPTYSADRHLHQSDERYREELRALGCTEIPVEQANPGDVLLFVVLGRRPASHTAILLHGLRMAHAYETTGKVSINGIDAGWQRRLRFAFRLPGVPE
ncbi:NlpC/P60 family protein [Thioalbus denitrificans]|uniref:NlpC/P60 family protein n=1 Tax=Thioalbus denitrificans TaxID=547122 RepID=A0A369CG76_9GAMM|nr:NlpC/P60 family protein [Thioalbus denitrificans]RCX32085.1 NlpC/P60 family protein [Thioalbus denitrificans]